MPPERLIPPELEALLLEAIEKTPDGIAIFSPEDLLLYCNATFAALFALTPLQAHGLSFEALIRHVYRSPEGVQIDTEDIDAWLEDVAVRRRRESHRAFQADVKDGRWYQVSEQLTDSGHLFAFATDITLQKQVEAKYRKLADKFQYHAETDALTGLNNRRNFFRLAEKELARCHREHAPAALLVMDIDHFKGINDNYGHQVGDAVLRELAARLSGERREYDILGRIGGEEFAMLVPGGGSESAVGIAERLRAEIEGAPFAASPLRLRVTLSVGVALVNGEATDLDPLVSRADQALYRAKNLGRNRVCLWAEAHAGPPQRPR